MYEMIGRVAHSLAWSWEGIGADGRNLLEAFIVVFAGSLAVNTSSRLTRLLKKNENEMELFRVVLTQPVGAKEYGAQMESVKGELTRKRPDTLANRKPNARRVEGKAAKEKNVAGEKKSKSDKKDEPSILLPVHTTPNVVAEIDFIESATPSDIRNLRAAYGFILVPTETYERAKEAVKSKGYAGADYLLPVEADAKDIPYAAVAVAAQVGGTVLSNSSNIRSICCKRGIPCYNTEEWRHRTAAICNVQA